jgi:hypothetical protein
MEERMSEISSIKRSLYNRKAWTEMDFDMVHVGYMLSSSQRSTTGSSHDNVIAGSKTVNKQNHK